MTRIRNNADWAPGARKTSGPYTGGPPKGILHATIAPSMVVPGYANQANAPHVTVLWNPKTKTIDPRQHYYYDNFAKSLRNEAGGVETNRDSALQWELAGYLGANNSEVPVGEFDILQAPNTYWEQVADHIGPVLVSWGVAPRTLFGMSRLSLQTWDSTSALMTHAQVPENDHWDLPISIMVGALIRERIWPTIKPPTLPAKAAFPLPKGHYYGVNDHTDYSHSGYFSATDRMWIKKIQANLRVFNRNLLIDGLFGVNTRNAAMAYQRASKLTVDGKIGAVTWAQMGIRQ